jgi:hypothetical protein
MTATKLRGCTRKELAQLAKRTRIAGWHGMKKEELVQSLLVHNRKSRRRKVARNLNGRATTAATERRLPYQQNGTSGQNGNGRTGNGETPLPPGREVKPTAECAGRRDISVRQASANGRAADRFEAKASGPFWIDAKWAITHAAVAKAEAALGVDWHRSVPVIRVYELTVDEDDQPCGRAWVRDIEIHGDVDHWHIPVTHPPRTFKLHIGYRTSAGRFYALASTGNVRTPCPGAIGTVDHRWKKETKSAKFPPPAGRGKNGTPCGRPRQSLPVSGNGRLVQESEFEFSIDVELIVHGSTHPHAEVTLLGEPVTLTKDGRFSLRFSLPDGRQVIPAVTVTPSGSERRTIVLAIERNTRELEPQQLDEFAF